MEEVATTKPKIPSAENFRTYVSMQLTVRRRTEFFAWSFVSISLILRFSLFPFVSEDMHQDMLPWSDLIQNGGIKNALAKDFCNYPPAYIMLLAIATSLPLPRLWAIKGIYIVFDYIVAIYAAKLTISQRLSNVPVFGGPPSVQMPLKPFVAILFIPTVIANASLWGQCDAIYASGMIACVYYFSERRSKVAMIALGLAFSIKPQAVFLAPWIFLLTLQGRCPWRHWYLIPAVFVVCGLPAVIAGRPWDEIVFLYADQHVLPFPALTHGATNFYQWLPERLFGLFHHAGFFAAAAAALGFIVLFSAKWPGKANINSPDERSSNTDKGDSASFHEADARYLIATAIVSVIVMPYFLPGMHERYFFSADVLSVAAAFVLPRFWCVAVLVQVASALTYLPYLFDWEPVPRPILAVFMTLALALAVFETLRLGGFQTPGGSRSLRLGAELNRRNT